MRFRCENKFYYFQTKFLKYLRMNAIYSDLKSLTAGFYLIERKFLNHPILFYFVQVIGNF
jgi:hypothetical protein